MAQIFILTSNQRCEQCYNIFERSLNWRSQRKKSEMSAADFIVILTVIILETILSNPTLHDLGYFCRNVNNTNDEVSPGCVTDQSGGTGRQIFAFA